MSKQVCLCKHVSEESIQRALDHGTTTLEGVKLLQVQAQVLAKDNVVKVRFIGC